MDIAKFQQQLTEFMVSQVTTGPGMTKEAEALRADLDGVIAEFGDQMPELHQLAEQLDLLKAVQSDPDLAAKLAEDSMKNYIPDPDIFDAIDDQDIAGVEDALAEWDINATHGENECTALYRAMSCMFGVSPEIVMLLLDSGADPKLGLGANYNVLHGLGFGSCKGIDLDALTEVIERCVSLGADIEQRSGNLQWTPLITAASEWNAEAVEALLRAGADVHARSGDVDGVCFAGETPLAYANGHDATRAVLMRYL